MEEFTQEEFEAVKKKGKIIGTAIIEGKVKTLGDLGDLLEKEFTEKERLLMLTLHLKLRYEDYLKQKH